MEAPLPLQLPLPLPLPLSLPLPLPLSLLLSHRAFSFLQLLVLVLLSLPLLLFLDLMAALLLLLAVDLSSVSCRPCGELVSRMRRHVPRVINAHTWQAAPRGPSLARSVANRSIRSCQPPNLGGVFGKGRREQQRGRLRRGEEGRAAPFSGVVSVKPSRFAQNDTRRSRRRYKSWRKLLRARYSLAYFRGVANVLHNSARGK